MSISMSRRSSNYNLTPSLKSPQRIHFSSIVNISNIASESIMAERKMTCKYFLKNKELELLAQNLSAKNSAFYKIQKNLTLDEFTELQNLDTIVKKKTLEKHKGMMFINELWSDRHYKKVVNESDLKPKSDMIKLQKKLRLFSEMLHDIDTAYKRIQKFNPQEQLDIINAYFEENANDKSKKRRQHLKSEDLKTFFGKNENQDFKTSLMNYEKKIVSLDDLISKLEIFGKLESSEKSQQLKNIFREVMKENVGKMDITDEKNMSNTRNFRNRMLTHFISNKHSRKKGSSIVINAVNTMSNNSPRKKINEKMEESIGDIQSKKASILSGSPRKSKRKDTSEEDDEFNIYLANNVGSPKDEGHGNKIPFSPFTKKKKKKKIENNEYFTTEASENASKIISKCENLMSQTSDLKKQVNFTIKIQEMTKNSDEILPQEIRQKKLITQINNYILKVEKKLRLPDLSKKEKEKVMMKKITSAYYVGYDEENND